MDNSLCIDSVKVIEENNPRTDAERVDSILLSLGRGRGAAPKRLREESAAALSKSSNRICLILQILMTLVCTLGVILAVLTVFDAVDWYFAVTYYLHETVVYAALFLLLWAELVVAIMMAMGTTLSASGMLKGERGSVLDVFCTFKAPHRAVCLKLSLAIALLAALAVALVCFALYGVEALAIYCLGYFGELGYYSVYVLHIPTLAAFIFAFLFVAAELFFAAPIALRYPRAGIIKTVRAAALLSKGRKKEITGLILRWTVCFALSLLSIGVVTVICVIPSVAVRYAAYCNGKVDEILK